MIISNSHRFIFVHVHKCGGTSITRALDPTLRWNDVQCGGTPYGGRLSRSYEERFGLGKHSPAADIRRVVGEDVWDDYFTFSFVRHPYARAVSLYTYVRSQVHARGLWRYLRFLGRESRRDPWPWPLTGAYLSTRDFSGFIRHAAFRSAPGARPLARSLTDESGERVIVRRVYKLENIAEDFAHLARAIGREDLSVTRDNVSRQSGSLRDYYRSEADYRCVLDLYRRDFELFDYDPEDRS